MILFFEVHEFDTIIIYQLQRGYVREPIRWESLTGGLVKVASNVAIVEKKLRKIIRGSSDVPIPLSRYS